MSTRRILVAASPGIAAAEWIERKLRESGLGSDVAVSNLGNNKYLSAALTTLGVDAEPVNATEPLRRSAIKKALDQCDYLLLFWDGRTLNELLFEARLRGTPTKVHAIEVTQVVNRDNGDHFDAYIGRGTLWGNPFVVGTQDGQFDRNAAIERYKGHFQSNILADDSKRRGLWGLRGMRLACHCKPLACHGDVIAAYLNALDPDAVGVELQEASQKSV
jgi:hypothetical protein